MRNGRTAWVAPWVFFEVVNVVLWPSAFKGVGGVAGVDRDQVGSGSDDGDCVDESQDGKAPGEKDDGTHFEC